MTIRVLVACEFSGIVGAAFEKRGCNVLTCDLLPSENPDVPHHQGDVIYDGILDMTWDLLIAHPPCTYLANSGVRWLYNKDGSRNVERWGKMADAADFFREFMDASHIPFRAVENPIQHRHAGLPKPTQIMQPWHHGHGESKAVCWWLHRLPRLVPTHIVEGREARVHRMPPGPDRQKERSRFFPGIAEAMADQWIPWVEARL